MIILICGKARLIRAAASSPFSPSRVITSIRMISTGKRRQYTSASAALSIESASSNRSEACTRSSNSSRGMV